MLDIIGNPNPKTHKLIRLHNKWYWPSNQWLGLERQFGTEAVLNAAGNSDEPINPATINGPELHAFQRKCSEELRIIEAERAHTRN
jgi:hypothetical protein